MKAGGYGGFEIQPVYPQSLDDPNIGLRNLTYLSDDFIGALRFAAKEGVAQGMRVDVTLGSGWPFGGPHVPVTQAASQILMYKMPLAAQDLYIAEADALTPDNRFEVHSITSSHSGFFRRPAELVEILGRV